MAEVTVEKGPQKTRDEEKERDPERLEGKGRELLLLAPFQAGGRGGQTEKTSECYSTVLLAGCGRLLEFSTFKLYCLPRNHPKLDAMDQLEASPVN